MDAEHPELEAFRRELINDLEEARLLRLTGGENQVQQREMSVASTSTLLPMSRETTVPRRGPSQYSDFLAMDSMSDANMDIDDLETPTPLDLGTNQNPLIIATDFGTTFSSVAFARRGEAFRPEIKLITNYPHDPMSLRNDSTKQVPTESWYPDTHQAIESTSDPAFSHLNYEPVENLYDAEDVDEPPNRNDPDRMDTDPQIEENAQTDFHWGYGIQSLTTPDMVRSDYNRVARSKLLLDKSEETDGVRRELRPVLNRLKQRKRIKLDEDVIADYLTQLFRHTKEQLVRDHGFTDATPIEHVLCVPVIWTGSASRTMQRAMTTAVKNSGLGTMDGLFLVSEPEAAAAYVLDKGNEVNPGEAFLILDAGGGTVDATTYVVDKQHPLRLSRELVTPKACLNGSSYLNDGFREHLFGRLSGEEKDIERDGYTIQGIIDAEAILFENRTKRTLDITNPKLAVHTVRIRGIKANVQKRFRKNAVEMNRGDFVEIFLPHLEEIEKLMRGQLDEALEKGFRVKKVILIGGFSASSSLRNYLALRLRYISQEFGYQIRLTNALIADHESETAVAQGAVLRALNKEDGPDRTTQSSYGFEITEPYSKDTIKAHANIRPIYDNLDGISYVDNVIEWVIVKGQEIPFHAEYTLDVYRVFSATRKNYVCKETLWVSDTCTESHYRTTHKMNKGKAEIAGEISADMTFLVTDGLIQPIEPEPGYAGKLHYRIEFELVMIVDGRNMRYEARWPKGGEARSGGQISIAAAFRPGTK